MGGASERGWTWLRGVGCAGLLVIGHSATASAGGYAVAGKVSLGPMCGGPQREGQSCDIDYADIEVHLLNSSGRQLASTRTDRQGAFRFVTAGTTVTVRVQAPKVVRCPDAVLHLPRDAAKALNLACDSGRR